MAGSDSPWTEDRQDELAPRGSADTRLKWVLRAALLALILVIFEATASVALTTTVGCLELGRSDLTTAVWVWRHDPDRRRGRMLALGLAAWAFLKVSSSGFLLIIGFACAELLRERGGVRPAAAPVPVAFLTACAVALFGLAVAGWFACWTTIQAWRYRRRLWIGPILTEARRLKAWPPGIENSGMFNRMHLILLVALSPLIWFAPIALSRLLAPWMDQINLLLVVVLMVASIGIAWVLFLVAYISCARRVLASSPAECWPLDSSILSREAGHAPDPI